MNKETSKKIKAIGMVALAGVTGAFVGAFAFPVTNEVTITNTEYITETVTEEIEVEVPVEVEVEKIVEVDNENLATVLDFIYDKEGNVEYLLDGLDDDEVDQIVDRVVFINDAESLAENFIKGNFAKYAEDNFNDVKEAEDVKVLAIDRLEVSNPDFEKYSEFDYMTADVSARVFYTNDGGDIKEATDVSLEIWNNKVRFN